MLTLGAWGRERGKVGTYSSLNDEGCAVDFSPVLG